MHTHKIQKRMDERLPGYLHGNLKKSITELSNRVGSIVEIIFSFATATAISIIIIIVVIVVYMATSSVVKNSYRNRKGRN